MKKNIWIFNHYVAAPGDFGITRHLDLGKQLAKQGHNVTIFASSFNHWERKEKKIYKRKQKTQIEYYEGVKIIWINTKSYEKNDLNRIFNMFSYWYVLRKYDYKVLNEKPDVVVGSIMHHFAGWIAYKVAKMFNAKFVFEERDLWPESLVQLGGLSKKNPIVKVLDLYETFMYKKADKIIVLFDRAPIYVQNKGIERRKVLYLPNGVEVERKEISSPLEIDNYKEKLKGKIILGYTGSHSRANNMHRLIELATLFKDEPKYLFVFVGEGSNKQELIKKSVELDLPNVLFLSPVSKKELQSVLKYFDYGIISLKDSPLYKWGFSLNKLYDYMLAELPIIMDTTLEENLINQNSMGFTSNDLLVLKNKIIHISETKYKKMSLNSKKYLLDNHDWKRLSERFEKEILEISD